MPLEECMRTVSHREYKLHVLRAREREVTPDQTSYYLMKIMQTITLLRTGEVLDLNEFKVPFEEAEPKKKTVKEMSEEEKKEYSDRELAAWSMITGYNLLEIAEKAQQKNGSNSSTTDSS